MILVFVETDAAGAAEPSLEAVTFARELVTRDSGDLAGQPIHALVVGDLPAGTLEQLGAHGVSEVHHAVGDAFAAYGGAAWAAALQAAQQAHRRDRGDRVRQPARQRDPGPPGRPAGRGDGRERGRLRPDPRRGRSW